MWGGGYKHDIANFQSYKNCSPSFQSFIASLDSTSIPTNWKMAKEEPKWKKSNAKRDEGFGEE
jgi:hypothetical protein